MIRTLRQFFIDIHVIATCYNANRMQDVLVSLSPEDRDLLRNFRRRLPSKEKA